MTGKSEHSNNHSDNPEEIRMNYAFDDNFLLHSETARSLYNSTRHLPIIDYHSHLPVEIIAHNKPFADLSEIWIRGDHYKWRAMRLNGVPERFCSGDASPRERFQAWARTLPLTIRSPLHHWSCLELKQYFDIQTELIPETEFSIWEKANALLKTKAFYPRQLLERMNVKVLCTTDDPANPLMYHKQLKNDGYEIKVLPTFRPDHALMIGDRSIFDEWIKQLGKTSGTEIRNFKSFMEALRIRHDAFAELGCCISDHGLERCYSTPCSFEDAQNVYNRYHRHEILDIAEIERWRSYLMLEFARWDHEKGWTMLLHLGALRNNNTRMFNSAGFDCGCDSIGDFEQAISLNGFLNALNSEGHLPKTVLFNSNPRDNLLFATVTGNFFEDGVAGKVQYGPSWWFLDNAEGIVDQLNALARVGMISSFVGMVTDSRSFLSFTRHDYFRRIVCNMMGEDITHGLIPSDMPRIEKMLKGIFYENACDYFGWSK